ncbi:hypothetical protein FVE85_5087 [Porphyridium purpureum]|uniref:Fe2OG dioxygenase domain-containing protein n=1 Tax=Porphyridium purpureum TaxID=35688 RepID=A0A5J4Z2V2_PORPP|nr:hypothetical protein FVE85_5087 [Porphyridium purpureum]|eukprot:POR4453..scf295_1
MIQGRRPEQETWSGQVVRLVEKVKGRIILHGAMAAQQPNEQNGTSSSSSSAVDAKHAAGAAKHNGSNGLNEMSRPSAAAFLQRPWKKLGKVDRRIHVKVPLWMPSLGALVLSLFVGTLLGASFQTWFVLETMGSYEHPWMDSVIGQVIKTLDIPVMVTLREKEFVSTSPDQPLSEIFPSYMDNDTFNKMRDCLIDHPHIQRNHLNPDGFKYTRGFVIKFSDLGIPKFRAETLFNCGSFNPLLPFFDKARDIRANGFVMNVLVADKPNNASELVVGRHVDNTLKHSRPNTDFLAHTVTVLYLSVPPDMEGGELEVLGTREQYEEGGGTVKSRITPVQNKGARFRGDAYHQVRGYTTETDQRRVSLVLEQYRVPRRFHRYLSKYEHSEKDGVLMM